MTYRNTHRAGLIGRSCRALLLLLAALPVLTATPGRADDATPPDAVELAAPYTVRPNGLSIRPPLGSSLRVVGTDASAQVVITPGDHLYRLEFSLLEVASSDISVAQVLESALKTMARQPNVLARRENLLIQGRPAEMAFFGGVTIGGADAQAGLCVVAVGPARFALLKMVALPSEFAGARPIFERVAETIDYADPRNLEQQRLLLVRRGQDLLEERMPVLMSSLKPREEWFRLYTLNTDGGEEELGYVRLRVGPGQRGEVSGGDPAENRASEREAGLTAHLAARYLPPEGGVSDIVAAYFLSEDRQTEQWKTTQSVRKEGDSGTTTLIVARQGSRLTATLSQIGTNYHQRKIVVPSEGYLSQVELYLLPLLLPRGEQTTEMGFWYFRESNIIFRQDKMEPAAEAGLWRWVSELSTQVGPMETIIDQSGAVRSKRTADGVRWEATTLEELLALWRRKGLPID
ncbi:MAG: hypothetical protein ACF8NJ_06170 [Phycisphaerales bacterium JB038]